VTCVNWSPRLSTVVVIDVGVTRLVTSDRTTMVEKVKGVGQDTGAMYTNGSKYTVIPSICVLDGG